MSWIELAEGSEAVRRSGTRAERRLRAGSRFMFCGEVTSLAACVQIVVGAIWTLIERSPLKRDRPAELLSSTLTSAPTVGT